jgi:Domain of unknown function (DUF4124)
MTRAELTVKALIAAMLFAPFAAGAQVYRWVDDEGRTIVSDSPPPAKYRAQRITKGDAQAKPAASPGASAEKAPGNGKPGEVPPKVVVQQTTQPDPALCRQAQQNLQLLESNVPLTTAGADGQPTVMDETSRAREVARLKSILQNCR